MKFGLIVDGVAEFASLDALYPQWETTTGNVFLRPIKADIQPMAAVGAIAKTCEPGIRQLAGRGADAIIVLVDREDKATCPPELAVALANVLTVPSGKLVKVVIKNRMFENWLISDLQALAVHRARFSVSNNVRNRVEPDKADHVDGTAILKSCCMGRSYDKVRDARRILERANVSRMGANSRSFRCLMRLAGDPSYQTQSRAPV